MGYWEILDTLEQEDKWWTSKELISASDCSYNTINKHLRKLLHLGYVIAKDDIKNIGNYKVAYKLYKASKFLGTVNPINKE